MPISLSKNFQKDIFWGVGDGEGMEVTIGLGVSIFMKTDCCSIVAEEVVSMMFGRWMIVVDGLERGVISTWVFGWACGSKKVIFPEYGS